MRHRHDIWIAAAAVGFALCVASPAGTAKADKHKKPSAATTTHAMQHRHATVAARPPYWGQDVVPAGPFYNGQDYLGDDPDPNIRSQIRRDMGRYGGPD